jgi:hypothetical protein
MANILGLITVDGKQVIEVDAVPSAASGTVAPIGSLAMFNDSGAGKLYIKSAVSDTAWSQLSTAASAGVVNNGVIRRLALYAATGNEVDDLIQLNSQNVNVEIVDQPSRSAPIVYSIPNPGDAVSAASFVLTEGAQTINGDKTFGNNVVVNGNLTTNGTLSYLNSTNTNITDELITLNKGGAASSAGGSGIEFEENSIITAYFKINSAEDGFELKAPINAGKSEFIGTAANQVYNLPDESGRLLLQAASAAGVINQLPYFISDEKLSNPSGSGANSLAWDNSNSRLGIGLSSPSQRLDVSGNFKLNGSMLHQEDADLRYEQDAVVTSNNTATTIKTVPIPTDSVVLIKSMINGRKSAGTGSGSIGDGACYERTFAFRNVSGTVTRIGKQTDFSADDVASWNADMVISGTNVLIQVQGSTDDTLNWEATSRIQILD